MNLEQRIQALDDRDAVRILTSFAQHQSDYYDQGTMTPDWSQALANETGVSSIGPVSEGLLARTALLVLADDPQHCEVLEALVSSPAPERYSGVIETAAVLSAVLFVLGTHVKLERDKAGQWTFKLEKKPTDVALLKSLMKNLLGFITKQGM
jgi:hypothetical protein